MKSSDDTIGNTMESSDGTLGNTMEIQLVQW